MDGLKAREASLLAVLTEKRDRWGETRLTMSELGELTTMSRTTLWRALTTLMNLGMVETTRTKRNLGKLYKNRYRVLVAPIKSETSTASPGNSITVIANTNNLNTSYLNHLGADAPEEGIETSMVNKWADDDEDMMGFGIVDKPAKEVKINKRDPKTRSQRPVAEWTAVDMASEFTMRVYSKVRGIPGMVNTTNLSRALAKNRKDHGVKAADEYAIMGKFFMDEDILQKVKSRPKNTIGFFLNYITENITQVSQTMTHEKAFAMEEELEYIYASDGRKFPQSISGRADLERYEKKLEAKKNG